MAPHMQQRTPRDEGPVQQEIVVAGASLEESTEGSSQQESPGNSNDPPDSLQSPSSGDGQPATHSSTNQNAPSGSKGKKKCLQSSEPQTPSKTARPKKVPNLWCDDCTQRKNQPGEDGRTRRNAKHHCPDCARLRREAGLSHGKEQPGRSPTPKTPGTQRVSKARLKHGNSLPTPEKAGTSQAVRHKTLSDAWQWWNKDQSSKPWKLAGPNKQQQEQNRGFDPATDSDDPDNPPKSIRNSLVVDDFGTPRDNSETIHQIQRNIRRWEAQPTAATGSGLGYFREHGQPNHLSRDENHTRTMPRTPHMVNSTSSFAMNYARGPQQQQPGDEHGESSLLPSVPSPTPGATSHANELQPNTLSASVVHYPDPMELDHSRIPNSFNNAMRDIQLARDYEALSPVDFELTGPLSSGYTDQFNLGFHSLTASSAVPNHFSGTLGSAIPAPADPEPAEPAGFRRYPSAPLESIDPRLLDLSYQPSASPPPAPISPGPTTINQNNG